MCYTSSGRCRRGAGGVQPPGNSADGVRGSALPGSFSHTKRPLRSGARLSGRSGPGEWLGCFACTLASVWWNLQLSIHSNSPIKHLNRKMQVSKINSETPNISKHITKNGSISLYDNDSDWGMCGRRADGGPTVWYHCGWGEGKRSAWKLLTRMRPLGSRAHVTKKWSGWMTGTGCLYTSLGMMTFTVITTFQ